MVNASWNALVAMSMTKPASASLLRNLTMNNWSVTD
jgi:hypothetical protein